MVAFSLFHIRANNMASTDGILDRCDSSIDEIRVSSMDLNTNPDPIEPYTGLSFKSVDDAREFYNAYSKRMGFTIRTNRIRHSQKSRTVIARDYVCSKEGFCSTKNTVRKDSTLPPRPTTREGCNAMMRVTVKDEGQWIVTKFIAEHNHKLITRNKVPNEQSKTSGLSEWVQQGAPDRPSQMSVEVRLLPMRILGESLGPVVYTVIELRAEISPSNRT